MLITFQINREASLGLAHQRAQKCQYAWMFYVIFVLSVASLSRMESNRGSKRTAPVFCHSDSPQAAARQGRLS
jgi:hypothetical protein